MSRSKQNSAPGWGDLDLAPVDPDSLDLENLDFSSSIGGLPQVPKRPGYERRWMRVRLGGVDDPENVHRKVNGGYWRPVRPDGGSRAIADNHPVLGDVTCTHDLVLMERRIEIDQKEKAQIRRDIDHLTNSVKRQLGEIDREDPGVLRDYRDENQVSTGSRVPSIPD